MTSFYWLVGILLRERVVFCVTSYVAYPSGAHCICLVYLSGLRSHAICMHLLLPNKNCDKLLLNVGMNELVSVFKFLFSSLFFIVSIKNSPSHLNFMGRYKVVYMHLNLDNGEESKSIKLRFFSWFWAFWFDKLVFAFRYSLLFSNIPK